MNALEIKGLTKNFGDFKLDNVDLIVPCGTILGLIGENGAGKSTTLKCVLNLIRRDSGEIQLFGRDAITEEAILKEDLGIVLDETMFHEILPISLIERILSRLYRRWDHTLFEAYCKKFELPQKKKIKEFSKGMKTKLSIACALSHHPKLLLLDEATVGLDPVVRSEILDEFLSFIQEEDHAVLLSSHITSDLEKVADYITYLHKGKVALTGTKDELLESYGRLVCSRADLSTVDRTILHGVRENQYNCEALIKDRRTFRKRYPHLTVDPITLEDIMLFTGKGQS